MATPISQAPVPTEKSIRRAKRTVKVRTRKKTDLEKIRPITRTGRPKKKPVPRKTPEELAAAHERQENALKLRMAGATYAVIAKELGYANPSSAKAAVDAVISRTDREAATEVVALDLARLDEYQMRCTHALRTNGDLHQIDRLMRIMEMRYRLLGVSDETIKLLQEQHGMIASGGGTTIQGNVVMNVHAAPETQEDFIKKMMRATGVNPDSPEAQQYLKEHDVQKPLPLLEGSANESDRVRASTQELEEDDIVEGEIVEEMDAGHE